MYCEKCGTRLEDGAKFCTVCGASLDSAEPEKKYVYCTKCGEKLTADVKFCTKCGAATYETPQPLNPPAEERTPKQKEKDDTVNTLLLLSIIGVLFIGYLLSETGFVIIAAFIEIVLISCLVYRISKSHGPDYHMKKAQEDIKKERVREEERARKAEAARLRTTIVATRLLGEGAAEYKKSVGSMATRAAVGSLFFGAAGGAIGAATAKSKNVNKNVRRFLVKYLDGHIEEKEAIIGSAQYNTYMSYLEWDSANK